MMELKHNTQVSEHSGLRNFSEIDFGVQKTKEVPVSFDILSVNLMDISHGQKVAQKP